MEITTTASNGVLDVALNGRLDGYWADHLDAALADAVRDGHHRIRVDCSQVQFLSSAGIGVLVRYYQELQQLSGSLQVVNPSKPVATSLQITKLTVLLVESSKAPAGSTAAVAAPVARRLDRDDAAFEIYDLDAGGQLICRTIGDPSPLRTGAFGREDCRSLEATAPALALGIGAFGQDFDDCHSRFGELLSVSGATVYQPAGSTNVPDYLLVDGALTADIQLLYGLACEGRFSHLLRFEVPKHGMTVGLSALVDAGFSAVTSSSIGFVVVAETAGLVGAALRRSPAEAVTDGDFFAHPGVRGRLVFTAEPAFSQGVTLAAGVVSRSPDDAGHRLLRPMGAGIVGHVHAAAFRFRPIRKGLIDVRETVTGLFEHDHLLGVLHLLRDDRGAAGAGESEFVRGACWFGPISTV